MALWTYEELLNKIYMGQEGSLQLNWSDCCTLQEILLKQGYAVLVTGGDVGDKYRIDWVYAGNSDNLNYADRLRVCFGSEDYLSELELGNYRDESEEK